MATCQIRARFHAADFRMGVANLHYLTVTRRW